MSTKTLRKRIALVAVSALGFGLVGTAPSQAANGDEGSYTVTAMTAATVTATPVVGTAVAVNFGINMSDVAAAGAAETRVATFRVALQSFPTGGGSLLTTAASAGGGAALAFTGGTLATPSAGLATLTSGSNAAITGANRVASATQGVFSASWTPAVAGSYTIVMWNDGNRNGIVDAAETSNTHAVTVSAASALPANQFPNSADTTASANGNLNGVRVSSLNLETVQVSGRTGIQVGFSPQYRLTRNGGASNSDAGAANNTRFATIAYSVTNPAGTAVTVVSTQGGTTASSSQAIAGSATPIALGADGSVAVTQAISPTTGWPQKGSVVFFSAATAGTYTITAFHDADQNGLINVGEATTSSTVVIAADALPSITMTVFGQSVGGATDATNGGLGQLVRISLRNGTLPASLGLAEVLTVTGPSGTVIDQRSVRNANLRLGMEDAGDGVSTTLTQANFDAAGNAYINIGNSTAGGGTYAITATITGGTGAGATGSVPLTVLSEALFVPTTNPDRATSFRNLTGVAGTGRTADDASAAYAFTVKTATATNVSIGYLVGAGATADSYEATLTDTYGLITGLIGGQYKLKTTVGTTATDATSVIAFTVPVPALASTVTGTAASLRIVATRTTGGAATNYDYNISQAAPAPARVLVDPASTSANTYTLRAAVGSTNAFTATVQDQFLTTMANQAVTAQVTGGRNTQAIATPLITDATGKVTFSVTDSSVSTLLTSDTLTFTTVTSSRVGTVTINYAATLPVATVEITGAASEDIAPTFTTNAINATTAGAAGTRVTMSATVKDANGATLPAGVAVTWSISGLPGTSAIWTDPTTGYNWATSYTNASGVAQTFVYAWATGTVTVSATAGGRTAATAGKINFVNTDTDARVVSATVVGNIITAKVVDRYGNAVRGVNLSATRTAGTGFFAGSASSGATGITGANGTVDFIVTGGDVTVTIATTTLNFGQTSSAAGQVNGTAVTATGIGASLSPAGVQSVTASVTGFVSATDAAIAANKATTDAAIAALKAQLEAAAAKAAADKASSDAAIAAAQAAAVAASKAAQDAAVEAATAAADAAAEATDAANAATDAANASAEAGDAATAAAQDAADAVAALSTQVSEMIDTLKKQITALTNLVIKIQKKVRA